MVRGLSIATFHSSRACSKRSPLHTERIKTSGLVDGGQQPGRRAPAAGLGQRAPAAVAGPEGTSGRAGPEVSSGGRAGSSGWAGQRRRVAAVVQGQGAGAAGLGLRAAAAAGRRAKCHWDFGKDKAEQSGRHTILTPNFSTKIGLVGREGAVPHGEPNHSELA
ncbi:unnamed protein product [Arctogadus glacialis]